MYTATIAMAFVLLGAVKYKGIGTNPQGQGRLDTY
jgi:hypothetical protein